MSFIRALKHLFKGDIDWFRVMNALVQGTAMPSDIVAAAALKKGPEFARRLETLLEYSYKPTLLLPIIWLKRMYNVTPVRYSDLDVIISSVINYGEKLMVYDALFRRLSELYQLYGGGPEAQMKLAELPEYQEFIRLSQQIRPPPILEQFARRIMGLTDRLSWIHIRAFARTYKVLKDFAEALTNFLRGLGINAEITPKTLAYWIVFLEDVVDRVRKLLGEKVKDFDDVTVLAIAIMSNFLKSNLMSYVPVEDLETAALIIAKAIYLLYLIETGRLISASKFLAENELELVETLGKDVVEYAKKVIRDLATFALRDVYFK